MFAAQYAGEKTFNIQPGTTVPPGPGEVRLSVGYVGICGTDMHIYHGVMDARVAPPQIIGHEMSGVVAEVGEGVKNVVIGDHVVVRPLDYCLNCPACDAGHSHVCQNLKFMGIDTPGAFQSSWTVKSRTLHKLPSNVSLKMGALVEPLAVACHDVARARVAKGEDVVVIGGGPIGQLVAMVAKAKGANVIISEVNATRRQFSEDNGINTIDPIKQDPVAEIAKVTNGKGADVVFEVSGVQPAVDVMTEIAAVRGRICMVAIHSQKPQVDLFKFFWKELELLGARVYEHEDFEQAIKLIADGSLDLEPLISSVSKINDIGSAFASMDGNPSGMKALVSLSEEF